MSTPSPSRITSRLQVEIPGFALLVIGLAWVAVYALVEQDRRHTRAKAEEQGANLARVLEEHTIGTLRHVDQLTLPESRAQA